MAGEGRLKWSQTGVRGARAVSVVSTEGEEGKIKGHSCEEKRARSSLTEKNFFFGNVETIHQ